MTLEGRVRVYRPENSFRGALGTVVAHGTGTVWVRLDGEAQPLSFAPGEVAPAEESDSHMVAGD